jgi:hypothetical protein
VIDAAFRPLTSDSARWPSPEPVEQVGGGDDPDHAPTLDHRRTDNVRPRIRFATTGVVADWRSRHRRSTQATMCSMSEGLLPVAPPRRGDIGVGYFVLPGGAQRPISSAARRCRTAESSRTVQAN